MTMSKNQHIGSSFDEFLTGEGIHAEVTDAAIKRVLVWSIEREMQRKNMTKKQMAQAMRTSRSSLNRFLDPNNEATTLKTMERAAAAVGKKLNISLEDRTYVT